MEKIEIKTFKDLIVWQRAMQLVQEVYKASSLLPREEQFGLTSQMRRSAISIPSNIAEGYKRRSRMDYSRFLRIADGSSAELETQLLLCKGIYPDISLSQAEALLTEIQKMLYSILIKLDR